MKYGEIMCDIRKDKNMLQTYSHYESGDAIIPIKHLIKISDYFNISLDYLLGLAKNKEYESERINIDKTLAGARLKEFRRENKLTQAHLAKFLNTTFSVISGYEKGRNIIATPFLYTICSKYNISADYLLGKIDTPKSSNLVSL